MSINPWVKYGKLQEGRSNLPMARRANDSSDDKARLRDYDEEDRALLAAAYRAAGEGSQATWSVPETPVKTFHEYFRMITSARYCNSHYAQHWPETATVYLVEKDRTLSPVIECRPGRGGNEFAAYVAGEAGPRIIGYDDLFYITDQPDVRGRILQEVEDGCRRE